MREIRRIGCSNDIPLIGILGIVDICESSLDALEITVSFTSLLACETLRLLKL